MWMFRGRRSIVVSCDVESSARVEFASTWDDRAPIVRVLGVLDLSTRGTVEDLVVAMYHGGDLVLDLACLTFCDCTGLGLLVRLSRRCAALGGTLRLAAPRGVVLMLMTAVDFGQAVPIYPDVMAAVAADATARSTPEASEIRHRRGARQRGPSMTGG
jgi:anti-anti-sigma factor